MDLSCKDPFPKINEKWGKIFLKIIFPPWNLHLICTTTLVSSSHIIPNFILKYECCTLANKSTTYEFTGNITTGIHWMFAQVTETIAFVHGKCICFKIHIVFQEKAIMNKLKLLELPLTWLFLGVSLVLTGYLKYFYRFLVVKWKERILLTGTFILSSSLLNLKAMSERARWKNPVGRRTRTNCRFPGKDACKASLACYFLCLSSRKYFWTRRSPW